MYAAIALSGASALGAEVVWTRLLGLMFGATVYVFSLILAVFLVGLGIGSLAGSLVLRGTARPRIALGCCQMALAGRSPGVLDDCRFTAVLAHQPLPLHQPLVHIPAGYGALLVGHLPAALLWGASFPLALAASARGGDPGRLVGHVYATNTGGAILGALAFSMVLIPWIGTRYCESVLIGICVVSALVVLAAKRSTDPATEQCARL